MRKKPTVLVVDDEKDVCELFERILKNEGYKILTANTGKEGLDLVDRKKPDLVVLDLRLPDMNGIEILRSIKKTNEKIQVIIMTGYGTMKTARTAMRLGAYDYVPKPFDIAYVRALIKDALSPGSDTLSQKEGGSKEVLNELLVIERLARISHCGEKKPCLWEVAVKAFFLGQDKVSIDWMEDPEIPIQEKVNLMELASIIKSKVTKG